MDDPPRASKARGGPIAVIKNNDEILISNLYTPRSTPPSEVPLCRRNVRSQLQHLNPSPKADRFSGVKLVRLVRGSRPDRRCTMRCADMLSMTECPY
jgi:hypothetical protein